MTQEMTQEMIQEMTQEMTQEIAQEVAQVITQEMTQEISKKTMKPKLKWSAQRGAFFICGTENIYARTCAKLKTFIARRGYVGSRWNQYQNDQRNEAHFLYAELKAFTRASVQNWKPS